MDFKDLKALICEEFGYDSEDIRPETLLLELVSDEYEIQELLSGIGEALGTELEIEPGEDWTLGNLAEAISEAL